MVGERTWDGVTFALIALGTFMALVGALRLLFSAECRTAIASCAAMAKSYMSSGDEDEMVAQARTKLCKKMLESKTRHYRAMIQLVCYLLLVWSILLLRNILLHGPRLHSKVQDCVHILSQLVSAVAVIWPNSITTKTMDLHYILMSTLVSAYVAPISFDERNVMQSILMANVAMSMLNAFRRIEQTQKVPVFVLTNSMFTLCACSTIYVYGSCCFLRPWMVTLYQLIAILTTTSGASLLEMGIRGTVRQSLQYEEVKELHSAATALLRSCCEVVVELDSEGVIISSDADLGSFLLRGSRRHNLQGVPLVDLIADEEDKQKFMSQLAEPRMKNVGLAENMQVSMKDGCNNTLRLELLWFLFTRLDRHHYMVGIREFSDALYQRALRELPPVGMRDTKSAEPVDTLQDPGSSLQLSIFSDDASVNSGALEGSIVVVDCTVEGLPIVGYTSGFCAQLGCLPLMAPLAKFVRQPDRFLSWVQRSLNSIQHDGEPPGGYKITLQMPQGMMKAICSIVPPPGWGESEGSWDNLQLDRVSLSFFDIGKRNSRGRHRRNSSQLRGTPTAASPSVTVSI